MENLSTLLHICQNLHKRCKKRLHFFSAIYLETFEGGKVPKPKISLEEGYQCLRNENHVRFNELKANKKQGSLQGCDFRGLDLKLVDMKGLDLRDAYFRGADLRGLDLSQTHLEGASLADALISGVLFPKELDAQEILLSVTHGIRLRYSNKCTCVNKPL